MAIKKITTSDNTSHDIDAKYWGGKEGLKTINGTEMFGSGDIVTPNSKNLKYVQNTNKATGNIDITLQPNACIYLSNSIGQTKATTTLTISPPVTNNVLVVSSNNGDLIESSIIFSITSLAPVSIVFDLDSDNNSTSDMKIRWINNTPPTFTAGKTYEINFIYPHNAKSISNYGGPLGVWASYSI
jgi:hypothetical protein